jgi:hypothetical protein
MNYYNYFAIVVLLWGILPVSAWTHMLPSMNKKDALLHHHARAGTLPFVKRILSDVDVVNETVEDKALANISEDLVDNLWTEYNVSDNGEVMLLAENASDAIKAKIQAFFVSFIPIMNTTMLKNLQKLNASKHYMSPQVPPNNTKLGTNRRHLDVYTRGPSLADPDRKEVSRRRLLQATMVNSSVFAKKYGRRAHKGRSKCDWGFLCGFMENMDSALHDWDKFTKSG